MSVVRWLGSAFVFVVIWLSLYRLCWPVAAFELDQSWAQAYGQALREKLRFGVDVVFTFGPLGYFYRPAYDPDLFRFTFWFELLVTGGIAWTLVGAFSRISGRIARWVFVAFVLLVVTAAADAPYFLASLALVDRAAREPPRWPFLLAATLLLAIFALTKFSFLVLAVLCVATIALLCLRRSRRSALLAVIAFTGWFLAGWCLAGQSPADLPAYLGASAAIAAGYSAAMSVWGPRAILACGVLGAGGCLLLVVAGAACGREQRLRPVAALLFAAGLLVAFKAGFVTQDVHVMSTFGVTGALALLLRRPAASGRVMGAVLRAAVVVVVGASLLGAALQQGGGRPSAALATNWWDRTAAAYRFLRTPDAFRRAHERHLEQRRAEFALPEIRAVVGNDPVDVFDWEQGIVFLNGLAWRPRPVLHSYMTYTPELMQRNAAFLASERAPRFLLFQMQPRADWLPSMADAAALAVICCDYRPLFVEQRYLLLERAPRPDRALPTDLPPYRQKTISLGEDVYPGTPTVRTVHVALDIRLSWEGRLRSLLYKPPPVYLTLILSSGKHEQYRIVPGMMRLGVLISPALRTTDELRRYLLGGAMEPVVGFRVEAAPGGESSYVRKIEMKLWESEPPGREGSR